MVFLVDFPPVVHQHAERLSKRDISGTHFLVKSILQFVLKNCIPWACAISLRPQILNHVISA